VDALCLQVIRTTVHVFYLFTVRIATIGWTVVCYTHSVTKSEIKRYHLTFLLKKRTSIKLYDFYELRYAKEQRDAKVILHATGRQAY